MAGSMCENGEGWVGYEIVGQGLGMGFGGIRFVRPRDLECRCWFSDYGNGDRRKKTQQ